MKTLALPIPGMSARSCELPLPEKVRTEFASWLPLKWQNAVEKRKAQSIGARWCAAQAALELGVKLSAVPLDDAGLPQWPAGLVGSLAHSDNLAVAVLSKTHSCLGVDVEELFDEKKVELLGDTILTKKEKQNLSSELMQLRWELTTIFSLKEAAYKALFPELRSFIDFPQLEVDLSQQLITHEGGRKLRTFVMQQGPHVISIAY